MWTVKKIRKLIQCRVKSSERGYGMGPEKCVICGAVIPEGLQVCPNCLNDHMLNKEQMVRELREIAATLKITAYTDGNIQEAMKKVLSVADRLEHIR